MESWEDNISRERVRLVEAQLAHGADALTRAEIALEWRAVEYRGKASAQGFGAIDLRVCAQATLDALRQLTGGQTAFRLIGVKSVKAFDESIAIVALSVLDPETGGERRLIGTAPAVEESLASGVARAVLNATNRVLGNFLLTGE